MPRSGFIADVVEANREIGAQRNFPETRDTLSIPLGRDYGLQWASRAFAYIYLKLAKLTCLALGGQCKYYAYRGTSEEGKDYRRGQGECAPDGYRPLFLVSTTPGTRSSLSALKCANNRSALAFHLGMPLFRSTNNIRVLFLFLSLYVSLPFSLYVSFSLSFPSGSCEDTMGQRYRCVVISEQCVSIILAAAFFLAFDR